MKKILLPFLFLSGLLYSSTVHGQKSTEISFKTVTLRLVHINWNGNEWIHQESDTIVIDVIKGQKFGDSRSAYLFTLDEILDSNTVLISFPTGFKLVKSNSTQPSNKKVLIKGSNNCFRIINDRDVVMDYCIDIMETMQYKYRKNNT